MRPIMPLSSLALAHDAAENSRDPYTDGPGDFPVDSARYGSQLLELRAAVQLALEGKPEAIDLAIIALLADGHVLIEDVPGVGKTTLARALAKAVGGELHRVQFTSDLLPSDLLGVLVFNQQTNDFSFRKGPVFTNVLVADEINRASPRTQSALMEAMSERQVSFDATTIDLPRPFFVLATQNPQDHAGTFPLPESQLDRFLLRIRIGYPPAPIETRLLMQQETDRVKLVPNVIQPESLVTLQDLVQKVRMDAALGAYLQAILQATRSSPLLGTGASTRAGMNLARAARARALLLGRSFCIADDIHELVVPVLAHRVRLAARVEGYVPSYNETEAVVRDVVDRIPIPL